MPKKKGRKNAKSSVMNVNYSSVEFKFSKSSNIGKADAADDRLLSETFYDNGSLDLLKDTNSSESIIVGRTGSEKTALIERLNETEFRIVNINPEELSLGYLVDSSLLRFFYDQGVKMDLFYKLLWNNIFISEILKIRYDINNEITRAGFLARLRDLLTGNRGRSEAIDYLLEWGDKFWLGTEYRVKEVVSKFEEQIESSVGIEAKKAIPSLVDISGKADHKNGYTLSDEQRAEIIQRGREVVSRIQSKRIQEIIKLLEDEILSDKQKKFYITIDKLDENWVNDDLRYQLIKALIEVARDINNRVSNVKIATAIRQDLIARVFEKTQDSGFQEEKFKSLYIDLQWTPRELQALLEVRINKMIIDNTNKKPLTNINLLPSTINGKKPLDYMIIRTMLRPRDLIVFFNICVKQASGKSTITPTDIFQAEIEYSQDRLEALQYEWGADYKNLKELIRFLYKFPANFTIEEVVDKIRTSALDFITRSSKTQDEIYSIINEKYTDTDSGNHSMIEDLIKILYRVGAVGIRSVGNNAIHWSFKAQYMAFPPFNIKSVCYIHPSLWNTLSIRPIDSNMGVI